MEVIWDPTKNEKNKSEHHISFEVAKYVFADPNRLERYDMSDENNSEEDRYQTLGLVGNVLFVVYTERQDCYRIISARLANKEERRIYNANGKTRGTDWRPAHS